MIPLMESLISFRTDPAMVLQFILLTAGLLVSVLATAICLKPLPAE